MEKYRPIDKQLLEACQDYPPDFGVIKALLEQGADVNAVSAADPDECLLTEIIFDYHGFFGCGRMLARAARTRTAMGVV